MQSVPSRGHPAHSQTLNRVSPESRGLDFRSLAWSEAFRAPVRPGWTRRATSLQQPPTRATPTGPSKGAAQRGSPGSLPAPLATTLRSRPFPDPVFWSLALALEKESHKAPNKLRLPFPGAGCPGAEAPAPPSHPHRAQSRLPAGPRSRPEARRPLRRAGGEAAPGERGCLPGADLVEVGAPRHGVAALVGVAAAGGFRLHGGRRARTQAAGGCCWGARARLRRRWRPRQQRAGGRGRAWVARGGGRGGRSRCPQPGGRREALSHGRRSGEPASEEEVAEPGARASRLDNHHDPSSPCPRGVRLSAAHWVPSWPQRPPCGVRPGPPQASRAPSPPAEVAVQREAGEDGCWGPEGDPGMEDSWGGPRACLQKTSTEWWESDCIPPFLFGSSRLSIPRPGCRPCLGARGPGVLRLEGTNLDPESSGSSRTGSKPRGEGGPHESLGYPGEFSCNAI